MWVVLTVVTFYLAVTAEDGLVHDLLLLSVSMLCVGARSLSDEAMGSTNYIAPEMQAGQRGPATGAVDVYALGKVMYWMLSGGKIFAREDHRAQKSYLPMLLSDQRGSMFMGFLMT